MEEENEQTDNDKSTSEIGKIEWLDLTVDEASRIRDFYCSVVGWSSSEQDMGSYSDYNINLPGTTKTVAGVCHARGPNASLPAQWLMYVRVADVLNSIEKCKKLGGEVIDGPRRMGNQRFCVIKDPSGAILGLLSDIQSRAVDQK